MTALTWVLIGVCISQSAMFSGSNLAFFSISKLRLQLEAGRGNKNAQRVMALRSKPNFLLVTILWGNVAVNVLLALASGSVLSGVLAFLFSTVLITLLGEIAPQAYFSRHALQTASLLAPLIRFYQILLYPVVRPTAYILDRWLGAEAINYFREEELGEMIKMHIDSPETEIDRVEGRGAVNFLAIDDIPVKDEGEIIDPLSILKLEFKDNQPVFPQIQTSYADPFLKLIKASDKKWIILVDSEDTPRMVLEADRFIRGALDNEKFDPCSQCHRPVILYDDNIPLGHAISLLQVTPEHPEDDVIDKDIIIIWADEKRIITGSDILGRLLRGIVK